MPPTTLSLLTTSGFDDYALLDSGAGRKLERFGKIIVDRPEAQALWRPRLAAGAWSKAHAVFSASGEDDEKGRWRVDVPVPDAWPVRIPLQAGANVTVHCKLSGLWHLGLFPEQLPHWLWMLAHLRTITSEPPRVLNLFGYTGAASLLAGAVGAEVTHIDASKKSVAWARENQAASKLGDAKIRWLVDDAAKFVAREVRRNRTYHVILIDPPKYGRGPDGEIWDLFKDLPGLLRDVVQLLAPAHGAIVLTSYAVRASALAFDQVMREALVGKTGSFETGELAIAAETGSLVPTSMFVRFKADSR